MGGLYFYTSTAAADQMWLGKWNSSNDRQWGGYSRKDFYFSTNFGNTNEGNGVFEVNGKVKSTKGFETEGAMVMKVGKPTVNGGKLQKGHSYLYGNAVAFTNPGTADDVGWLRVTGTDEYDTVLEIATGDNGGSGDESEVIVARQYNTLNSIVNEMTLLDHDGNTRVNALYASDPIYISSDQRLKSDIKALEDRGPLQPKTYIKDGKPSIGFIAQDVKELYPELVTGEESETEYLSLNYPNITAVLAVQINDLRKEVEELKKTI